jgi:lipoprotein-releasing system ATP-binding protein
MSESILKAVGVEKSFRLGPEELQVLNGIDLELHSGEILAVTGPSGSGKSTLLNILGTLEQPSRGEVYFDSTPLSRLSESEITRLRNRSLGFVFQFHHLLPEFTALENVAMPLLIAGISSYEAFKRARDVLIRIGLGERLKHRPAELSGGEKQRVALSRALVTNPVLLLADEPTGNLDGAAARSLIELLRALNQDDGVSIFLVTHNEELARCAHRRYKLIEGGLRE